MFMTAVLANHPDWAETADHQELLAQSAVRKAWLLGTSGDTNLRKIDLIWYWYFATGDKELPLKVRAMADTIANGPSVREICVRTYCAISELHPELVELAPELLKLGAHLSASRMRG